MIEGPTTIGEALSHLRRQLGLLRAQIQTHMGDRVIGLAVWIYLRSGRHLLAMEIAKALRDSAADELAAIRGVKPEGLTLEDRCGAARETETHQIGRWPRDCQKCHDHIAERNR